MVYTKRFLLLYFLLVCSIGFSQSIKFNWENVLVEHKDAVIPFTVPNTEGNLKSLRNENILIKRITDDYIFVSAKPLVFDEMYKSGKITDFYLEFSNPTALDDTARALLFVDEVHQGLVPLSQGYTGEGVIMAFIDQGLDFTHPDFIDANGNSRVIRYWDQGAGNGATTPPQYGYGQICDSASINDGTCPFSEETSAHGTTVTGIGSGNGSANGTNMGMAPDCKIIFIETNFGLPNWTLTIADACDYVFKVADSLNRPAVINLSVGSYLGSHDGNDPASVLMEDLIDEKGGRLIVSAAGNSGGIGNYHVRNDFLTDTSFIWLKNNPNGTAGANTILFDLWSDVSEANYSYAYGADRPNFSLAGSTDFNTALGSVNTPLYDTIWNNNGDRIATIITYTETVGGALHIQGYFNVVDSLGYNFRFMTTGNGSYDLWSTTSFGLSEIVENIPSVADMPFIANYILPDANQSIVSSWNCSEKIVSTGNVLNRTHHIDFNGNTYTAGGFPGELSGSSSKGPSRHGVIKPNVTSTGNVTLAAAPAWLLGNASYNGLIDSGGFHARNGGTSMASPTVAGIGALMLEKCSNLNYDDFLVALQQNARTETFMGNLPNNSYGFGIANAFEASVSTNFVASLVGDSVICGTPAIVFPEGDPSYVLWYDNTDLLEIEVPQATNDIYAEIVVDSRGCTGISDTIDVVEGTPPATTPVLTLNGNTMTASNAPNYQWFLDGAIIVGETNSTLQLGAEGTYMVGTYSGDGCWNFSDTLRYYLGIEEEIKNSFKLFPNPSSGLIEIENLNGNAFSGAIFSVRGEQLMEFKVLNGQSAKLDLSALAKGVYFCNLVLNNKTYTIKVIKE